MRSRATVIISFALAGVLLGGSARAHPQQVERSLFLEPSGPRRIEVLLTLRVPGRSRRIALDALADRNHDGRYDPAETRVLERYLLERALDGLAIRSGTTALTLEGLEAKTRVDPGAGPVTLMLHARLERPVGVSGPLVVSTGPIGDHLDLTVLSRGRALSAPSRGRLTRTGLAVRLGHGEEVSFDLE